MEHIILCIELDIKMELGFKNMKKKNNRIMFVDIARGIAILLMIAGHVLETGIKRSIIFSFHMPLFIIISGYFYKERSLKEEIKNSLVHLIIPATIIMLLLINIRNIPLVGFSKSIVDSLKTIVVCWSHQSKITYGFEGVSVLWFIYMIVLVKIIFMLIRKISKDNELMCFGFVLIVSYIGYIIGISGYWLPWSVDVSFACMVFYYFGYLIKKYNLLNSILTNNTLIIALIFIWIIGIRYNCIEIAVRSYPNGLWSYITAICGSLVILKLSSFIEKKSNNISKFLAWCGSNSLYILMAHYIEISIFAYNLNITNLSVYKFVVISPKCL